MFCVSLKISLKIHIEFFMRRDLKNKNIRKIYKRSGSYALTIPMEIIKALGIRNKQKVVVEKRGDEIIIKDWKPACRVGGK